MKTIFAIALALAATACGTANNSSDTQGLPGSLVVPAASTLAPVEGSIAKVEIKAAKAPAMGFWTEVTVEYMVPCTSKMESKAVSYDRRADGKIEILSSAFVSTVEIPAGTPVCQAFQMVPAVVAIPGFVSQDDLVFVNLRARAAPVPARTMSVRSVGEVKVLSTRDLCPKGALCRVGGTVVTVSAMLSSCVNTLGPVAYRAEPSEDGDSVKLFVNAVEFNNESSLVVRCMAAKVVTAEIALPMIFADAAKIDLRIVQ